MKNKPTRKAVSCGIIPIFINEKGEREFLLVLQTNNNWSFPKGHSEENETFLETAKRELFEETGLICENIISEKIFSHSYIREYDFEVLDKTVHYFIGYIKLKKVSLQEEEIKDFCWCSEVEVFKKMKFENAKKSFMEILNYLKEKE